MVCGRESSNVKRILIFCLCSLIFLTLPGCQKKEVAKAERVINVQIQEAQLKSFRPYVQSIGTLKAYEEVIASSQVEGILKSLHAEEGTPVSRGSLLAEIDDRDIRQEVVRDEAMIKQTRATLANAQVEFKRKDALYKEQLVTQQQFDDISTRLALAEADVEKAQAALALSREKLAKTRIASPLQGFVKEKKVSVGDYIRNGTPLFTLIRINPIKLLFTVTEKDVGKLKVGQQVQFKIDSLPDKEFTAKVSIVYPHLEEKTRTLQVEAIAPNPDARLKPGLFSRVVLYTEAERQMTVVPITSILYDESKTKIFIADGNRAKERSIRIGGKYGELIEIVEGLKAGERVVVVGQNNLAEGVKINVAR
jgi:RND family efflux transporter MFP subunit